MKRLLGFFFALSFSAFIVHRSAFRLARYVVNEPALVRQVLVDRNVRGLVPAALLDEIALLLGEHDATPILHLAPGTEA